MWESGGVCRRPGDGVSRGQAEGAPEGGLAERRGDSQLVSRVGGRRVRTYVGVEFVEFCGRLLLGGVRVRGGWFLSSLFKSFVLLHEHID